MRSSQGLVKIQTLVLVAVVVVAAVAGGVVFVLWSEVGQSTADIKIGVCADLDNVVGKEVWQAVKLASEQINAEGGVLGRKFTVVAEDDDDETLPVDVSVSSNAMTKLITVDKADFVISDALGSTVFFPHQDICSEHKKIMFGVRGSVDNYTQRVIDNYDAYKYFFKLYPANASTIAAGMLGDIVTAGNYTGLTKIAFIGQESNTAKLILAGLNKTLPKAGFDIVYTGLVPATTLDFTSNFAAAEAAGAEIIVPIIASQASVSFVKEWHDRQSPSIIWGILSVAEQGNFWDLTEGKCQYVSFSGSPAAVGYPLTNKTVPTRDAYFARWGTIPTSTGVAAYDGIRFILPDAIKRAGTTETEAVIDALEKTNIETSTARHFVFTSSHDVMVGSDKPNNPAQDYMVVCIFQWQADRKVVPVKPTEIMKEAGATFLYPPWDGPWGVTTP